MIIVFAALSLKREIIKRLFLCNKSLIYVISLSSTQFLLVVYILQNNLLKTFSFYEGYVSHN